MLIVLLQEPRPYLETHLDEDSEAEVCEEEPSAWPARGKSTRHGANTNYEGTRWAGEGNSVENILASV